MNIVKKAAAVLPGLFLAVLIAAASRFIEDMLPVHLVGASVIALFIGMIINGIRRPSGIFGEGLKFTSKKILKLAIILLGASLNIKMVLEVGKMSLYVMFFTLIACFGGGYFIGKALKIDWKLSNLISAGTGICGGSAIAAIAPAIDAEDKDIAYAMSATFLFDMAMIVLFPIMGYAMGLSDMAYGLWTGTAVNDTSSVIAAGYAYSEAAGDFAAMVKLTRTLSIIPAVIVFAMISAHLRRRNGVSDGAYNTASGLDIKGIFPWFILGFLGLAAANSLGLITQALSHSMKELSKFLMIAALAAIGLSTSFKDMKKSGIAPMIHGFIISLLVVIVAFAVEYFMGII